MSQPFKLYRLQQIDSQLDKAHQRLHEIAAALTADESVRLAEQQTVQADDLLQAQRKALRKAEENVASQRIKIEQTESALYGGKVRNPKELQDLQNEAAALKRHRSVLEDRQLEAMMAEEEAAEALVASREELAAARAKFEQESAALIQEQARLNKDVERLGQEHQAAASGIPPEDISLYNQLRQQRRGIAVSRVTDRACSACGSVLSAVLLNAARNPNQITRCETCSRILYIG